MAHGNGNRGSPPRIGGVPERSEGGVVDQVPEKILQYVSDLPPRLAVARRPLLFQEGSRDTHYRAPFFSRIQSG